MQSDHNHGKSTRSEPRYTLLCLCLTSIAGCAAQGAWVKDGGTTADYERDRLQCVYEANMATASYSQGQTAYTRRAAILQGISEGFTMGLRQAELSALCMRARGYYYSTGPRPTAYIQQPAPQAAEPQTMAPPAPQAPSPPPVTAPAPGKFGPEAERIARSERCHDQPSASLAASGPGFETYTIPCASGDALSVRCEFGNCRILK